PSLERRRQLQYTTMATSTQPAPSSAVLLIYPATLLLGSLFSIISPTAHGSRALIPPPSQLPGPLAPSLAADLYLSENPVNYFARKNNIFNVYFVKIGWLWTTLAFASLLFAQPSYYTPSLSPSQQQTRFRRALQSLLRYALVTTVWYLMTQWFFGPPIIDRGFVATGGKCRHAINKLSAESISSAKLETVFTAGACKAAGGAWTGGHDISGHVFMLVLVTAHLAFEAIGVGAYGNFAGSATRPEATNFRERKTSDPDIPHTGNNDGLSGFVRTWSLRLVWAVVGLGWWMLFMTAIWFHTWLEKWAGMIIALSTIYTIYVLPRKLASWRDIVGLPGI
ncbi:Fat storage-inducing transmembrane protein, partial [Penicillium taxi]|uniref:Fat storage-inducing transmembrane protein n=1 Tax=Penicillium taxi TaxID=168475 RepID=UPI002544F505